MHRPGNKATDISLENVLAVLVHKSALLTKGNEKIPLKDISEGIRN